jgi:hypothetical protein
MTIQHNAFEICTITWLSLHAFSECLLVLRELYTLWFNAPTQYMISFKASPYPLFEFAVPKWRPA